MSATKSIFRAADNAELVQRIQALRADTRARWGKMDVGQMLAHCQRPLRVATGELELRRNLVGILFGRLAKKKLAGPQPFGRSLPTAPAFVVKDPRDFAGEQRALLELVRRFGQQGPAVLSGQPHPFFGPLNESEWDALQWKHLDHHLRQFGV